MLNIENATFPWSSNESSIVINADCFEALKCIEDHTVDLIFVDPPYGLKKDFGDNTDQFRNAHQYFEWAKQWLDECMRVLKKDGTLYLMSATQHMAYLDVYMSENYHVINRIIWHYDSSGVQPRNKFGSLFEPILMCTHSKNSKYTFNAQDILEETKTGAKRGLIDYRKTPPQPYNTMKIPGNVWNFNRVRFRMPEYENHPTQKPEALLERIILASSNPGDVVLDPFAGTFTASAVATRLGRIAIGIELNEEYFKIGLRRTGITNEYKGELLTRDLSRKTTNKNRNSHKFEGEYQDFNGAVFIDESMDEFFDD